MRSGLKLFYDELGWQVDTSGNGSYAGSENVPVTTEANQADIYGQIPRLVACDPAISAVNIFGFVDEGDRGAGFQAGLVRKDGTPRPSLNTFRDAIAGGCAGGQVNWAPATGVVGAGAKFSDSSPKPAKQTAWQANATAAEDAHARLGLFKVKNQTGRRCTPGRVDFLQIFGSEATQGTANLELVADDEFEVKAGFTPLFQLDRKQLTGGCYVYAMELEAALNPERTSTFASKGFLAGAAAQPAKPDKPAKPEKPGKKDKKGKK